MKVTITREFNRRDRCYEWVVRGYDDFETHEIKGLSTYHQAEFMRDELYSSLHYFKNQDDD